MTMGLYAEVYRSKNLHLAWRHVRRRALNSVNDDIREEANNFEATSNRGLKSIQGRLVARSFQFRPAKGVLKDVKKRQREGKDPRPVVIADLETRIVQRAILQVLQPDPQSKLNYRLGNIRRVNESPYGIGGLRKPYGGTSVGIKYVLKAIADGYDKFFKSDIEAFYTKVPHEDVLRFIATETGDHEFTEFFHNALSVELENFQQLNEYLHLFPDEDIGVAQGSSLSAFAGNVLLLDFDMLLNGSGCRECRYIDDLIILGRTNEEVQRARSRATHWLKKRGMALYDPATHSRKAETGHVRKGLTFLGFKVFPNQIEPSAEAKIRIKQKVKQEIQDSKSIIEKFANNSINRRRRDRAFTQTLARIDLMLYGWGQSFSVCTNRLPFAHLDSEITKAIREFQEWYLRITKGLDPYQCQRALGVALLQDIPKKPLWDDRVDT